MPKTNLQQQIFIDALPSKVWKVLTNPDYTDQYLPGGSFDCQWTEGCTLTVISETEGKIQTISKGRVLQVIPGVLLKYNLQEEGSNDLTSTTYELIPADNGIELKIFCEGFTNSEDYFFRLQQIKLILQKIKWLAEYA